MFAKRLPSVIYLMMDTPTRTRPTITEIGAESPATKSPVRRLSADAISSLSLEGSVSSSGSAGQPDGASPKPGSGTAEAFPSGFSDTSAAAVASLHHQTECEFAYVTVDVRNPFIYSAYNL